MKKEIIVTFLFLVFLAFFGIYQLNPPHAAPIDAPKTEFSSGRAMRHLEAIAQNPHPIGSPESAEVRDYIVQELEHEGLKPEVQTTTVVNPRWGGAFPAGTVHNIVAKYPGTNNTKAILVAAHYDSVPTGCGASDDGAGVAAMLETARALNAGLPLKNDVIFLFTDGEEAGLLGAKAFVDEHPWAQEVGVALNFEARGNSGPSLMFETSSGNGWLIQEFAASAPQPVANSLFHSIYQHLPNDTDLTIFKEAGWAGLNFSYINGLIHYHAITDSVDNINASSLQHHGDYALSLTRHLGHLNLQEIKARDAVYFDILGLGFVHYSEVWVTFLTAFVALLFIGVVTVGINKKQLTSIGIALGFLFFGISTISVFAIVTLIWWSVRTLYLDYGWVWTGDTHNSNLYMLGFTALTLAITSGLYGWFCKKISVPNLTIGAWLWWLILMVVTSIYLPGASYLFTWPLLFSLLGLGFTFTSKHPEADIGKRFPILSLCTLPGIALLVPTIYLVFVALSLQMSSTVMVLVVLLLGLLLPHICLMTIATKWLLPATSILLGLCLIVVGNLTVDFNTDSPKPNSIFYGLNADTGQAIWASADEKPDPWTSQFLSSSPQQDYLTEYLPMAHRQFLKNQAPPLPLAAPKMELMSDNVNENSIRTVHFKITVPSSARLIRTYVEPHTAILAATVNDKKISSNDTSTSIETEKPWGFHYFSPPQAGLDLTLTIKASSSLEIRTVAQFDGLPQIDGNPFRERPNFMMPNPFGFGVSDTTLVSRSFTVPTKPLMQE